MRWVHNNTILHWWMQATPCHPSAPQAGVPCHMVQVIPSRALLLQGGFRQADQAGERCRAQVLQLTGAPACVANHCTEVTNLHPLQPPERCQAASAPTKDSGCPENGRMVAAAA